MNVTRVLGVAGLGLISYVLYMQGQALVMLAEQNKETKKEVKELKRDLDDIKDILLERQAVTIKYTNKDLDCLARNIFYEAGIESRLGKYAVAQVTLNRVKVNYKKWGNSICSVVYARKQFSWTSVKKRAWEQPKGKLWEESLDVAHEVLNEGVRVRPLKKALFYHTDYVNPRWRDNSKHIKQIGAHIFYTQSKGSSIKL